MKADRMLRRRQYSNHSHCPHCYLGQRSALQDVRFCYSAVGRGFFQPRWDQRTSPFL